MKKALVSKPNSRAAGLAREYRFDYSKSRANRFVGRVTRDSVSVVLDPDVASVFTSSKSVNAILRSVILAMPKRTAESHKTR